MTTFTLPHDEPDVARRHGYGVAVCDSAGRLRELAYSVPLASRVDVPPSYKAVVRGDGVEHDAIGKVIRDDITPAKMTRDYQAANTPTMEQDICHDYQIGASMNSIREKYGIHEQKLTRILAANGIAKRTKRPPKNHSYSA